MNVGVALCVFVDLAIVCGVVTLTWKAADYLADRFGWFAGRLAWLAMVGLVAGLCAK